jgi:hypothetical protein
MLSAQACQNKVRSMPNPKLTNEIIHAAIWGLEEHKRRINVQISDLRAVLSGGDAEPAATVREPAVQPKRKMSAATRKAMGEAQRKRWAAARAQSGA